MSAPFVASTQTVAEMFDISQRMHLIATRLASEAHLSGEVQQWHASANVDMAAFNELHNL
jgi:hypothetical protein